MDFCLEQTVTTPAPVKVPKALSGSVKRPAPVRLTRGNVGASPPPQNDPPRLDCLARTERFELLIQRRAGGHGNGLTANTGRLALNFRRRKEWTSAAKRASLSPCRDKGRLALSGGSCPAGDSATAARLDVVRTRYDSEQAGIGCRLLIGAGAPGRLG